MKQAARKDKEMNIDQLSKKMDKGFENMAKMVAAGFEQTATKDDLVKIDERLAVVEAKLDKALYTSVTSLEVRVKRLEQKIGIK